jgi:hypothetical protein
MEGFMKRSIIAALSILAVGAGVGWTLANHAETSAGLQGISLKQNSEHSQPGPANALAGIRIRLSGSEVRATDAKVPQVSLADD